MRILYTCVGMAEVIGGKKKLARYWELTNGPGKLRVGGAHFKHFLFLGDEKGSGLCDVK